jgi:hypothetical protein
MKHYFTQEEAEAKIGQRIRTKVTWASIPVGTHGTVVGIDEMGKTKSAATVPIVIFDVVIRWDVTNHQQTLTDWFTKEEYEQYLEEIGVHHECPVHP